MPGRARLGQGGANAATSGRGGVCGIQGNACFWEVLQGVGLALLSLSGTWGIHRGDVAAGSPAGRAVARTEFHLPPKPGVLLLLSWQRHFRPFSSGSQNPACFQPGALSGFAALWKAVVRAVKKGNTTFIPSFVSWPFPSERIMIFICLPALPLGPDGICRGPWFPFPQHKCSVYFVFPLQFLRSLRVPGHSSPCFCPELAPSCWLMCLCPDPPHQFCCLKSISSHVQSIGIFDPK